ncbi:carbohydrate ABC transporter permease [Cohnella nanjingensis]|uniref:Carbohydrate ABC transporter permease n=1 Tax=Cohnella nanjingensis TaxID=1387779 RepID=A0A7X0VI60_9BACL|nr:carbohydrate ABC transporter permease [Cohnella nanjingensis]MBB6674872.1 carbohydrate ABC transporter permease [Cohnella nanjingensis]
MRNGERGIISAYDLKKPANKIVYYLMVLMVAVMAVSMLYPIAVALFNGLKANVEVNTFPPHFLPQEWHFDNYKKGWDYIDLTKYLKNTLFIFAGSMVVTVILSGLASFSLSRLDWPFRKGVYYFFLSTLFIPPTTYIIPNFINLKDIGLINSYWAFWLPAGANAFYLLLLKSFFDGINQELFESFRVDGASELRCFFQLAFPLSMPIFATLGIFVFSTAWNEWFWPSLVMSGDHYPLATAIKRLVIDARRLDTNIRFAILTMVMLPPIAVFLIFQRFIVRGLNVGSVKG